MMDIKMWSTSRLDAEVAVEHTVRWANIVDYAYGIDYNDLCRARELGCKFALLQSLYFTDNSLALQELTEFMEDVPIEYAKACIIELLVPQEMSSDKVYELYYSLRNYIDKFCEDLSIEVDFLWTTCNSTDKLKDPKMEIRFMLAMNKQREENDDDYIKERLELYNQQMSEIKDKNHQMNITL